MKIKRVEPIAVSFPMKKPVFMAGVEIRQADNILVRIEADNAVVGWGEAASAPTMTGETVESMMAAVAYLAAAVEGRPAEDIAGTVAAMATRMYANNAAKAAIEMALHDLVGRATGRPAHALLGGKQRSRMAILGVISTGELASDLREAERKKADGYSAFKIKVGIDKPLVDAERTRRVCEILGREALISSDANQGWSADEAVQYVRAVADAGLDFFEQPVHADDIDGMAAVAAASRHDRDRRRREHSFARGYPPPSRARRGARREPQDHQARRPARRDGGGPAVRPAWAQRQRLRQDRQVEHRLRGGNAHRRRAAADRVGLDPLQRGPHRRCDRAAYSHRARTCGSIGPSGARHRRGRGPGATLPARCPGPASGMKTRTQ